MELEDLKEKLNISDEAITKLKKDLGYQIGTQVELARIMRGMTQAKLAELLKTKQPSIARVESGQSLPSLSFLKRIADALETELIPPTFKIVAGRKRSKKNIQLVETKINTPTANTANTANIFRRDNTVVSPLQTKTGECLSL